MVRRRLAVRRFARPSPLACPVCGSRRCSLCPWGGPWGSPSRPVLGFWVQCLSCSSLRGVRLPSPLPLSVAARSAGVWDGAGPSPTPQSPTDTHALDHEAVRLDKRMVSRNHPPLAAKLALGATIAVLVLSAILFSLGLVDGVASRTRDIDPPTHSHDTIDPDWYHIEN